MGAKQSKLERYQAWYAEQRGMYARERCRDLLRHLISGWPRRSRSMLAFCAGSGPFAETLHESGFDLTCQDHDQDFLELSRERMGSRCEFVLSAPDHLPFDDCSFDYAVAVAALEFWDNPEAVLEEMGRVACNGVALIFPNLWSLFGLECQVRTNDPLCSIIRPRLISPRTIYSMIHRVLDGPQTWISVLPSPSFIWGSSKWLYLVNGVRVPLPVGAFVGVRVDFSPQVTGTPLLLRAADPVASAE